MHKGSLLFVSLPTLVIAYLFDDGHSNRCEVIAHCSFHWDFLMISELRYFSRALPVFFGKIVFPLLCHFSVGLFGLLLLNCMRSYVSGVVSKITLPRSVSRSFVLVFF